VLEYASGLAGSVWLVHRARATDHIKGLLGVVASFQPCPRISSLNLLPRSLPNVFVEMICTLTLLAAVLSLGTHLVASAPADFDLTASRTIASVVPDWPETVVAERMKR